MESYINLLFPILKILNIDAPAIRMLVVVYLSLIHEPIAVLVYHFGPLYKSSFLRVVVITSKFRELCDRSILHNRFYNWREVFHVDIFVHLLKKSLIICLFNFFLLSLIFLFFA